MKRFGLLKHIADGLRIDYLHEEKLQQGNVPCKII